MITSTANAQVKELVKLMKKSRARDEAQVFLIEGPRMAGELADDPDWSRKIEKIYLSESYAERNGQEKTPQGILAVVERRDYDMSDILGADPANALVLVLDNLQDPGNLGTIFRTAEAAGVTGIILSRDCVDIYNPKVVRSTMGAVLRMPFLYVDDLPGTISGLKEAGIKVYAAHLKGELAYDQEDYRTGSAFLIGNEGNGLRDEVAECADHYVIIPMQGKAESLNAAVAAALLVFEAGRQRRS